jgi:glycerophosphoryl diester phosphodiesterase
MKRGGVANRRAKWAVVFLLGVVMIMGAIYGSLAWSAGEPAGDRAFFRQAASSRPLVIAHRGGAGLWPENTLYAFERARGLGVDVIELDVRSTSDGVLVVIHDATVDRTTDGTGRVNEMTFDVLRRLNAGYRWSPDGGRTFPFRESNLTVPTLQEVFAALPGMKFNIEPKQTSPSLASSLCRIIREHSMVDSVVIGSFNQTALDEFRRECSRVATSASPSEVSAFLAMYKAGVSRAYSPVMQALQVPEYAGGVLVLTAGFVEAAHERNLKVHAWTVNETEDMQRLLGIGVDGIMTDYPDRLLKLIGRR